MTQRMHQLTDFVLQHGDALDKDVEAQKMIVSAIKDEKQKEKPPVYKLEDLPRVGPPSKEPTNVNVQTVEPWQRWGEAQYQRAVAKQKELAGSGQTQRAAKGAEYIRKWEQAHGFIGGGLGQVEGLAGIEEQLSDEPKVTPNTAPVLGEPPQVTAQRQAYSAAESEKLGITPKYDHSLDTLSQLDDPRYKRPSEYTARESPNYGVLDMVPMIAGGKAEIWQEPSIEEFKTLKRAEFGDRVEGMNETSLEYRKFADESWVQAYDQAVAEGRPIYRSSAKWKDVAGDPWGRAGQAAMLGADAILNAGLAFNVGMDEALTGGRVKSLVQTPETKEKADKAVERFPRVETAGEITGYTRRVHPANLAAEGAYGLAKAVPGVAKSVLGRTAAGAAAGAAGAGAGAAIQGEDTGLPAAVGGALGGLLHIGGEGLGAMVAGREPTPMGEGLRQAQKHGVRVPLVGRPKPPPEVEQLRREAYVMGSTPADLQAERMMPGMRRGALASEAVNDKTPTAEALNQYFRSPEGKARVSVEPVIKNAEDMLYDLTYRDGTPRPGVNESDVRNLQKFVGQMRNPELQGTMNASELTDAITRVRRHFNLTPGSESNLTPEGKQIAHSLEQELLSIRDKFQPNEFAPEGLRYMVDSPGGPKEVRGLSALSQKRAGEQKTHEGKKQAAGLPKGRLHMSSEEAAPSLRNEAELNFDQNRQVRATTAQYGKPGAESIERDQAIQHFARLGGVEKELKTLAANNAAENIETLLRQGGYVQVGGGGVSGWMRTSAQNLGARTDPLQRMLSAEPAGPFSEGLLAGLRSMRKQAPTLKGGGVAARAADILTDEDIGNLKALLGLYRTKEEER